MLFVNFSAGEREGRVTGGLGVENEQEVSFSLMDEKLDAKRREKGWGGGGFNAVKTAFIKRSLIW